MSYLLTETGFKLLLEDGTGALLLDEAMPLGGDLLQENGFKFLLENGTGAILLEASSATSLSAAPLTLTAGSIGDTVILSGGNTTWTAGTPGNPTFTLSTTGVGAAITSQQVLSATSATLTVNAGTAGTITITDPSTGDTAQIQVAGAGPTTRVRGFRPWPSFLPPFNGAAESVPFEAGYFVSGLPAPLSTSIGGQLLVVFIPDGTVRVHIGVPSYLTQPSLVSATPNAFYNKYIRFAYPQVTTQALAVAQGSSILPLAYTGGILAGDSLIIIPAQASALYATVQSVFSDHVVLTAPLVADVSSGSLVIDVNNQS